MEDNNKPEIEVISVKEKRQNPPLKNKASVRKTKNSWRRFWIGTAIYGGVLLVLFIAFQIYTNVSLRKYEDSQSVYTMQKFFDAFVEKVGNGFLPEEFGLTGTKEAEELEYIKGKKLTFDKDEKSYSSENPEYAIFANDEKIAKVKYAGVNEKVLFAILTTLDWEIEKVEWLHGTETAETDPVTKPTSDPKVIIINPDGTTQEGTKPGETNPEETKPAGKTRDVTFTMPASYTAYIDDVPVVPENPSDPVYPDELTYVLPYIPVAGLITFTVKDVKEGAHISMTDHNGDFAWFEETETSVNADYLLTNDIPQSYKDVALNIAETWSLFMTDDIKGNGHGFGQVAQYLIKDSDYYKRAYDWATQVDITFTSPHTLFDPIFKDIVVDQLKVYQGDCFSIHISFSKDMLLTLRGDVVNDATDATYVFIYYDDPSDGAGNPHWVLADMISK